MGCLCQDWFVRSELIFSFIPKFYWKGNRRKLGGRNEVWWKQIHLFNVRCVENRWRVTLANTSPQTPPHFTSVQKDISHRTAGSGPLLSLQATTWVGTSSGEQTPGWFSGNFTVSVPGRGTWRGLEKPAKFHILIAQFQIFFLLSYTCVSVLSCVQLCDVKDYSPPVSSVHGIFQARILEWVAISFSKGSSWPRVRPTSPACIGRVILYHCVTWEALIIDRGK